MLLSSHIDIVSQINSWTLRTGFVIFRKFSLKKIRNVSCRISAVATLGIKLLDLYALICKYAQIIKNKLRLL